MILIKQETQEVEERETKVETQIKRKVSIDKPKESTLPWRRPSNTTEVDFSLFKHLHLSTNGLKYVYFINFKVKKG